MLQHRWDIKCKVDGVNLLTKKNSATILLILLSSVIISSMIAGYIGLKAGKAWINNNRYGFVAMSLSSKGIDFWHMPRIEKLLWALSEAFGLETFHSDYGQDKWVARFLFPDVENGYFVDVGSGDGVASSNTKLLEDVGWKGICIDPFPRNMEHRNCRLFKEVVYGVAGEKVRFRDAGFLGGIDNNIGLTGKWPSVQKAKIVEFTTVTLDDILARANAPDFIHYMSIDIEGAELEALKGLSFSKYKVGAFTIEHNLEEPKRSQIRSLLGSKGYRFVLSLFRDDCYVNDQLMAQ
jgi:FkbM family methyltransferase